MSAAPADKLDVLLQAAELFVAHARRDVHAQGFLNSRKNKFEYKPVHEPITPERLSRHLNGGPFLGAYLIPKDSDTTRIAGHDLDDKGGIAGWNKMCEVAAQLRDIGKKHGLEAWPIRSGGGKGIQLLYRWDKPQPAAAVRDLLRKVLATAGFRDAAGDGGVAVGEVEVFPKQDQIETGRLGNLLAVPFGRKSMPLSGDDLQPVEMPVLWLSSAPVPEQPSGKKEKASQTKPKRKQGHGRYTSINEAALADIKAWAPVIFPHGRFSPNGAFRVKARDLGANFEEDLSIYPNGIRDFGSETGLTPIQVIEKWGGVVSAQEAAAKLCELLHLDPKEFCPERSYEVIRGSLHFVKRTKDGPVPLSLCNFAARIEEQRMVDDGVSTSIHFQISGTLANGAPLPRITLPVQNIKGRPWWIEKWGASAVVTPALGETHLLAAMQTVSAPVPERVIYSHLGWRKLSGRWVYLHADGAIGEAGAVEGFEVEATGELMHYKLPAPVDLAAAVKASLDLLEVGPVGVALAAAVYRAPLSEFYEIACSLFVAGATGVFKSAITGVGQAHWGVRWDGKSFPGNWTSTANSLEKQTFAAKDAVMVIDDFAPRGTSHDVERLNQTADRLLRGAGNRSGRGRMNADGTLRETYWPRGMIVATGEDVPKGHSLRARMVIVDVKKGEIDKQRLSNLQAAAADGRLAQAMAGYVAWIARQADDLPKRLSARCIELRTTVKGDHARTGDNLASLLIGLEYMLKFAEDAGAITASKSESLWKTHSGALASAASGQDCEQVSEEPAERFRSLIRDALGAGRAHLCTRSDDEPSGREAACGWQKRTIFGKEGDEKAVWEPRGDRIGFMDGDDLWLNPAAAYSCAERLGRDQNRSLGISLKTLGSRLGEAGWLLSQDDGKSTTRLTAGEQRLRCYHLSVAKFLPELAPSKQGKAKSEQAGPPEDFDRSRPPVGEPEYEM